MSLAEVKAILYAVVDETNTQRLVMTFQSKYQPLQEYLRRQGTHEITVTIAEIEALIGERLPATAHTHRAWWSNRRAGAVQATAWMGAGYYAATVDLTEGRIIFRKPQQVYRVEQQGKIIRWDAELVKALRHHMGLTQAEFARELGIRQPTVSEWETGIYEPRRSSSKLLTMVAEAAGFPYIAAPGEEKT